MKKIITVIKNFFISIWEKWHELNNRIKIIVISGLVLIGVIISVVIICSSGESEDASVIPDITPVITITAAPTPTLTPSPVPTVTAVPTPTLTPTATEAPDIHVGEARSQLTGEWQKEELTKKRPYAIMFNNIGIASPQSGIGDADILYEAVVEAGITRLMGIFEGLDENSSSKDRIGSVRSARHYFCSFADEYDAIFIHYGETTYATKKIKKLKLDHLEGTYGIGETVFYRDKTIKAPHNAFASLSGIQKGIEKLNIRTEHEESFTSHYNFYEEDTDLTSDVNIKTLILPYSSYMTPYFTYDSESKLYTRYQFDDVHIDYNTGEPLKFKNIIIQVVNEWDIDENGYQTMAIEDNNGEGYYITNGKLVPITWVKCEKDRFMRYYDKAGNELTINTGRTFVSIFPDYRLSKLSLE